MSQSTGVFSLLIDDLSVLRSAYMPFLINGGLFIPLEDKQQNQLHLLAKYHLGDKIFLVLQLPQASKKLALSARIAWITPARTRIGECIGVGIHFEHSDINIKKKIESLLDNHPNSELLSQTL